MQVYQSHKQKALLQTNAFGVSRKTQISCIKSENLTDTCGQHPDIPTLSGSSGLAIDINKKVPQK